MAVVTLLRCATAAAMAMLIALLMPLHAAAMLADIVTLIACWLFAFIVCHAARLLFAISLATITIRHAATLRH